MVKFSFNVSPPPSIKVCNVGNMGVAKGEWCVE